MFRSSATLAHARDDATEKLEVYKTEGIGLGVRALTAFPKGAILDRFTGEISSRIKQHSLQIGEDRHISGTRFVGYLSHGCDPNAWLDMKMFELVARRDIEAGDLVTIDYAATEDRLFVQFVCTCGARDCRRWITGRRDPISTAGLDYLAAQSAGRARV